MEETRRQMVRRIEAEARGRLARLAKEFTNPDAEDREGILASLEIERWLVEICRECRNKPF